MSQPLWSISPMGTKLIEDWEQLSPKDTSAQWLLQVCVGYFQSWLSHVGTIWMNNIFLICPAAKKKRCPCWNNTFYITYIIKFLHFITNVIFDTGLTLGKSWALWLTLTLCTIGLWWLPYYWIYPSPSVPHSFLNLRSFLIPFQGLFSPAPFLWHLLCVPLTLVWGKLNFSNAVSG